MDLGSLPAPGDPVEVVIKYLAAGLSSPQRSFHRSTEGEGRASEGYGSSILPS